MKKIERQNMPSKWDVSLNFVKWGRIRFRKYFFSRWIGILDIGKYPQK